MTKEPLILIPARDGSKGIPHKNTQNLGGFPLISYVIRAAKEAKLTKNIVVSTDSEKIKNIAEIYGASVPFLRPHELALDTTPTLVAVRHAIDTLKSTGLEFDDIILLQPTQPFISAKQINEAYTLFCSHSRLGVAGISPVKEHPILMRTLGPNGRLSPIQQSNATSTIRRQDMPKVFKINGSIYINRLEDILHDDMSFNDNPLGFIMDNKSGFDIDNPSDLYLANLIISQP